MSQTLIPALSDSPLMTISVGTLPASKPGMMLDVNPFASHLARLSGPETATRGAGPVDAPAMAGQEGGFAMVLAQGSVPAATIAAGTVTLAEAAQLPEDASPSQVIEALMGGAAEPSAQVPIASAAVVAPPPAPVARPIIPAASAPIAPGDSEAAAADDIQAAPHAVRPRRPGRLDGQSALAGDIVPVAAPMIAPSAQTPVRPEAHAPDTGSRRAAISAMPAPAASAPAADVIETRGSVPADILAGAAPAEAPDGAPHLPAPRSAQTGQIDAGAMAAQPDLPADARAPAAPTPVTRSAVAVRPVETASPGMALPVSSGQATATPAPGAAAAAEPRTGQTPAVEQSALPAPSQPSAAAIGANATTRPARPVVEPIGIAGSPAALQPAAWVPSAMMASPDPAATTARAGTPRSFASAAGQRSVQSALQTARPAQALGAVLDGVESAVQPALDRLAAASGLDTVAALPAESVPPSWAAALNAIISPAVHASQGLVAAAPTGNGPTGHLETLAFDAGFVGNVETQIASVAGGGQMVRMQIMPEHLGRIDIEMLAGPERDQIRITTEHDAVRDTLIQSQVRLEQDLRSNSHRVADVTVELRQQSAGTQGGSAQQQRGQSGPETAGAREAAQRQAAADTTADSKTAQRRPRDNVRYA